MRTLIVSMLLLSAPAALAAPAANYTPDWNRRPPPAAEQRGLAGPARHLDQIATQLYYDIRSQTGRSEMSSRARELAEATHDFRRLAERGASLSQLREAHRRVGYRHALLERRFENHGREFRHRFVRNGLQDIDRAMQQANWALQRYAQSHHRDRRDGRWDDHDGKWDRYVFNPRDADRHRRQDRED